MRIISGQYRGRRLASVPEHVRPSTDRLREALFSILAGSIRGSVWLDLFAGSGAVGIEALSRGARHLILNDRSSRALRLVRKNLEICQVEEGYEIHQMDAFVLLKKLEIPTLDYIFLDPPRDFGRYEKLLREVSRLDCLQATTQVILETFKKAKLDFFPEALTVARRLRVGDNQLIFLRRVDSKSGDTIE
jgi:16S rRNA (guanine(966)-N(2))-methyltransferase RsmD